MTMNKSLPFNAPHMPLQAPKKYLDRFPNIDDGKRKLFAETA